MVRKAVVVGINYVSNGRMLRGACADAYSWEQLLAGDLGFAPSRIRTLTDEDREGFARQGPAENLPTHEAIVAALEWLVEGAAPGDVIVFVFAGFATQVLDPMCVVVDNAARSRVVPVFYEKDGALGNMTRSPLTLAWRHATSESLTTLYHTESCQMNLCMRSLQKCRLGC